MSPQPACWNQAGLAAKRREQMTPPAGSAAPSVPSALIVSHCRKHDLIQVTTTITTDLALTDVRTTEVDGARSVSVRGPSLGAGR